MRGHQQANPNAYAYPASQGNFSFSKSYKKKLPFVSILFVSPIIFFCFNAAMPNYGQAPPPQYTTTEAYGKQSPYNPTYGQ